MARWHIVWVCWTTRGRTARRPCGHIDRRRKFHCSRQCEDPFLFLRRLCGWEQRASTASRRSALEGNIAASSTRTSQNHALPGQAWHPCAQYLGRCFFCAGKVDFFFSPSLVIDPSESMAPSHIALKNSSNIPRPMDGCMAGYLRNTRSLVCLVEAAALSMASSKARPKGPAERVFAARRHLNSDSHARCGYFFVRAKGERKNGCVYLSWSWPSILTMYNDFVLHTPPLSQGNQVVLKSRVPLPVGDTPWPRPFSLSLGGMGHLLNENDCSLLANPAPASSLLRHRPQSAVPQLDPATSSAQTHVRVIVQSAGPKRMSSTCLSGCHRHLELSPVNLARLADPHFITAMCQAPVFLW